MNIAVPLIVGIVILALIITALVLAWRRNLKPFWISAFAMELIGSGIMLSFISKYANLMTGVEGTSLEVAYGRAELVCLIFILLFLGLLLMSVVLAVGKHLIRKQEEPLQY
ncbi:MAG: hypothetical protein IIZ60_06075 [Clostridia bacterium]|nr:hypothetical protein [Clostridia bacterium]